MYFEKGRWFPGLLQVFDLQSPYADVPWLDTGVESTIGCFTDVPWLDTGIESGISRL